MKKITIMPERLAFIVVSVILNLGIGFLIATVRLPFYLDSIGTVLAACVLGPVCGIIVGVITVLIGAIYMPTLPAYVGTAIVIALYVGILRRYGYLKKWMPTIFYGMGLGCVSAIVSAPITAVVYGGVSLAGTDVITSLLIASGKNVFESVFLSGIASDPFDKLLTSIIVMLLIKRLPATFVKNV